MNRPWCCPEPRCAPIYQIKDGSAAALDQPQPGQSFSCFGKMTEPVAFEYDGVKHVNELSSCHYTTLKGVMRWQEAREDWMLLAEGYTKALAQLEGRA